MTYGVSNGHVTDDVTWPQRCCEAVRSAILATAWLLVDIRAVSGAQPWRLKLLCHPPLKLRPMAGYVWLWLVSAGSGMSLLIRMTVVVGWCRYVTVRARTLTRDVCRRTSTSVLIVSWRQGNSLPPPSVGKSSVINTMISMASLGSLRCLVGTGMWCKNKRD